MQIHCPNRINAFYRKLHLKPEDVFHAAVMPCFDKKLEAARLDFANGYHEVDCVLSTGCLYFSFIFLHVGEM